MDKEEQDKLKKQAAVRAAVWLSLV